MTGKRMTAKQRVLLRLAEAEGGWVWGVTLADVGGYRFGARIYELRHEDGYVIERRTSPRSAVDQYRLVPQDEQLRIAL
jgi:hypothetical protein